MPITLEPHGIFFFKFCIHMHVNIVEPLACIASFLMDGALLSISSASCGQLVKMLITLEPHGIHVC